MLKITGHKGFHLTFKNGWTASVQFGPGSYTSSHHDDWDWEAPKNTENGWESFDAEVAAWEREGPLISLGRDTVKGWLNSNQVLSFLNWVAGEMHDVSELESLLKKDEN
ncbi:MAG: hypothetical protein Q7R33_05805 [Nitrosarchaeum sp.]|nr:hypothetical protein [Nitrosarchaeum sp.]